MTLPHRWIAGLLLVLLIAVTSRAADPRPDILIADFEGPTYGDWKSTGDAFGPGPARGTLPDQMQVNGFRGKGLVNTYFNGDRTTGTLTSPPFAIERRYISFLVGGGHDPEKTCMNLLVDGKPVRNITGPNKEPGGTERLDGAYWDVADLAGKTATLQIVDQATGGWGHINIDHIVLTDVKPRLDIIDQSRTIALDKRYLNFPVKHGAPKRRVAVEVDGAVVREFEIELAEESPDFWVTLDVSAWKGKPATIRAGRMPEASTALASVEPADSLRGSDDIYREPLRPQFHFSPRRGWNNDPNGMVYHDGEWHLYFQHNPYGWAWGNMHWGHAVSKDLVHWQELPIAIYPKRFGDWAFSGSAVVDRDNVAGFKTGSEDVIVAAWTSTGRGECISYSNDRGRTFTEFDGNPVVKHKGRDPKLIWHAPSRQWVMAVYDEEAGQSIAFYTSPNLRQWTFQSRLDGYFECPEIFPLAVDGDAGKTKWVIFAADAKYAVGSFDGKAFTPDRPGKHQVHYGRYYASQTFSDVPASDGRRIQIGWGRIDTPGMPFNQMMTFPCELTLRTTDEGVRLLARPVREIEKLHRKTHERKDVALKAGQPVDITAEGDLFDIRAEFAVGDAKSFGLMIGGRRVVYDVAAQKLDGAALKPVNGRISLQVLVDRSSIEICGNDGRVYITESRTGDPLPIRLFSEGGDATALDVKVHELNSAWK